MTNQRLRLSLVGLVLAGCVLFASAKPLAADSCPGQPDGTPCDDGDACTQTDTCQSDVCTGANPVVCTAIDACHVSGNCDPGNGICSNPEKPNGSACNDADACTQTDTCQGGTCVGGNPVICAAGDDCHDPSSCD